jgi:gamma-glutamylputrescine oxidase
MLFNGQLNMAGSYYAKTAAPAPEHPALAGDAEADIVVIGGGCTGLSAALHAADQGQSAVVLEGGRIGWGASGRNGGQMIPGLRKGAVELIEKLGPEPAKALFDLAIEARDLVVERIARHGIDCDLRLTGHLLGVVKRGDLAGIAEEAKRLVDVMEYPHVAVLDAEETRAEVASGYVGGLMDRNGGHLHPLNYTLGLARAAAAAGVRIHENSAAVGLESGSGVKVKTARGTVRARHAILAGDALLEGFTPRVTTRIMPVASYVVATEPLADPAALIPNDVAVSDSRFVVNYYRRTADGRLLFGGGERYTPDPPRDIPGFVRPYLEATFPQLRGVPISHGWGGLVSVTTTRLPHLGRDGPVLFAHGYSGMGVLFSTLAGKLLIEAISGDGERFDRFAALEPSPFPGGVRLRAPIHVLAMLWFAFRDRI